MAMIVKILADSVNPASCRITTFECKYPRIIHDTRFYPIAAAISLFRQFATCFSAELYWIVTWSWDPTATMAKIDLRPFQTADEAKAAMLSLSPRSREFIEVIGAPDQRRLLEIISAQT